MTKIFTILFLFLFSLPVKAQTSKDYTVQANVTVETAPPKIIFNWVADANATSYSLSRKLKGIANWTVLNNTLPATATQF